MFYRFRPVILGLAALFSVFPKPVLRWFYRLFQPWPGLTFVLLRYVVARNLCAAMGDNVYIGNDVTIHFFERLRIGSNVSIHTQCYLDANGTITIGNDVSIAHATSLVAFEHGWSDRSLPIRKNPLQPAPIHVADDVWIGAGVRILAGASIPGRSIVAAGAVVTARLDAEPGHLIAGVPAKARKALHPENEENDARTTA